jgi:hypothetical protein
MVAEIGMSPSNYLSREDDVCRPSIGDIAPRRS